MWSGNLVSGPGFAFIINGGHSSIGGGDYWLVSATSLFRPVTIYEVQYGNTTARMAMQSLESCASKLEMPESKPEHTFPAAACPLPPMEAT